MNERVRSITIAPTLSILAALKKMDEVRSKLLLIRQGDYFGGLLSIGDIQRAIINNRDLSTCIMNVLRKDFWVCYDTMTRNEIRLELLKSRSTFMPILSVDKRLIDVVFWDEFFPTEDVVECKKLGLPVVIMAGGVGSRLRPLTNVLPKPLLPIGEKTIVETIMEKFNRVGCHNFYISLNYKASLIRHFFKELPPSQNKVTFFEETTPLGTGGSLSMLRDKLSQTFFVTNCDIILDQAIDEVLDYHRQNRNELTIVAALKHVKIAYGALETGDDGLLKGLSEKPEWVFKVNTGVYILEPHLLMEIPDQTFFNMTDLIDAILLRAGRVGVFPVSEGSWTDIGNWDDYKRCINICEANYLLR